MPTSPIVESTVPKHGSAACPTQHHVLPANQSLPARDSDNTTTPTSAGDPKGGTRGLNVFPSQLVSDRHAACNNDSHKRARPLRSSQSGAVGFDCAFETRLAITPIPSAHSSPPSHPQPTSTQLNSTPSQSQSPSPYSCTVHKPVSFSFSFAFSPEELPLAASLP